MLGMRWKDWKTMPIDAPRSRASASSPSPVQVGCHPRLIRPDVGRSRPAIAMSSVDLPLPDGPTRESSRRRAISRSIPLSTWTAHGAGTEPDMKILADDDWSGHARRPYMSA